jgi:tetratricopeptide (TPR) repeat protein
VAPRNVLAWDHLGTEWMVRNRRDLALEMYRHALAINPNDWNTNFAMGMTYYTNGDLVHADQYLSRACELRSGYANQYYFLGDLRLQMGRLPEAEAALRKALEIWPSAVGWHQTLGVVLEREGDLAGARDQFQAELANNPASNARQQLDEVQARLRGASVPAATLSPAQKR